MLPSFAGGGAERVVLTMARHLDRERFAPALIVLDGTGPLRNSVASDIPVVDLETPRLRHAWRRLGRTLEAVHAGVVIPTISHVNLAVLALRHRLPEGTRVIVRESNTPSASLSTTRFPRLMHWLYRRYFPAADAVMCPSELVADEFSGQFGLNAERLVVLPHPVDVAALRDAAARPVRIAGDGLRFVAAGRMAHQKGFDRLLELFAGLPDNTRLTLMGEGREKDSLKAQADRLGLSERVDFPGFVPRPWAWYAGADAFLLPSRWEGMPNAALEALAVGTPVIAWRDAGGISEIGASAGAISLAGDADGFAAAMREREPHDGTAARPSLLPARFERDAVMSRFQTLIETTMAT